MPHAAYGPQHRRVREMLMRALVISPGKACPICGEGMWPGSQKLDLHHSDPARKYSGLPGDCLSHTTCNRSLQDSPAAARMIRAGMRARDTTAPMPTRECGTVHAGPLRAARPGDPVCRHCGGKIDGRPW